MPTQRLKLIDVINNPFISSSEYGEKEPFANGFTKDLSDFVVVKEKKYGRVGVSVLKWG